VSLFPLGMYVAMHFAAAGQVLLRLKFSEQWSVNSGQQKPVHINSCLAYKCPVTHPFRFFLAERVGNLKFPPASTR
jgi:hypothetical protein